MVCRILGGQLDEALAYIAPKKPLSQLPYQLLSLGHEVLANVFKGWELVLGKVVNFLKGKMPDLRRNYPLALPWLHNLMVINSRLKI